MTIAFLDVQYLATGARAACVVAPAWSSPTPLVTQVVDIETVQDYEPGALYRRELPCLLRVLERLPAPPDVLVVDGYVWLLDESAPGLGARLHDATGGRTPVVGIAKTAFRDALAAPTVAKVLRGDSARPLFVTAIGLDLDAAATCVRSMAGDHRMPLLLTAVDRLARSGAPSSADD